MKSRALIATLVLSTLGLFITLALGLLLVPLAAEAQPSPQVPRIGVLSGSTLTAIARSHAAFLQGLHALGYVEGQTIVLEGRWAEGKRERLPALAAELVRLRVEVIVAGNVPAARAASQATQHIPIVVAGGMRWGRGSSPASLGRAATLRVWPRTRLS
jgi:putative tryptophan/tyrosine transport system substrate-binding protein